MSLIQPSNHHRRDEVILHSFLPHMIIPILLQDLILCKNYIFETIMHNGHKSAKYNHMLDASTIELELSKEIFTVKNLENIPYSPIIPIIESVQPYENITSIKKENSNNNNSSNFLMNTVKSVSYIFDRFRSSIFGLYNLSIAKILYFNNKSNITIITSNHKFDNYNHSTNEYGVGGFLRYIKVLFRRKILNFWSVKTKYWSEAVRDDMLGAGVTVWVRRTPPAPAPEQSKSQKMTVFDTTIKFISRPVSFLWSYAAGHTAAKTEEKRDISMKRARKNRIIYNDVKGDIVMGSSRRPSSLPTQTVSSAAAKGSSRLNAVNFREIRSSGGAVTKAGPGPGTTSGNVLDSLAVGDVAQKMSNSMFSWAAELGYKLVKQTDTFRNSSKDVAAKAWHQINHTYSSWNHTPSHHFMRSALHPELSSWSQSSLMSYLKIQPNENSAIKETQSPLPKPVSDAFDSMKSSWTTLKTSPLIWDLNFDMSSLDPFTKLFSSKASDRSKKDAYVNRNKEESIAFNDEVVEGVFPISSSHNDNDNDNDNMNNLRENNEMRTFRYKVLDTKSRSISLLKSLFPILSVFLRSDSSSSSSSSTSLVAMDRSRYPMPVSVSKTVSLVVLEPIHFIISVLPVVRWIPSLVMRSQGQASGAGSTSKYDVTVTSNYDDVKQTKSKVNTETSIPLISNVKDRQGNSEHYNKNSMGRLAPETASTYGKSSSASNTGSSSTTLAMATKSRNDRLGEAARHYDLPMPSILVNHP